ncbi:hypothetical protein ABEB36_004513 [Hypothenemus hampei]|uniref:DUF4817 domain-containing protein n=1 Tax=Hypothenemus hampei TaxID=57062 RepID=A0ABD1F3M2_HYPHA
MEWTKVERAFAVEAFFSNGHSIIATQRAFRTRFNIAPRGRVPDRRSIVSWVANFREIGDVKKKKKKTRLISLRGDLQWPARSPDLAPCDFFLWGYLKSLVYNDRPRTLPHLKNNIRQAIANIPIDMLERVERNYRIRLTQCIENNGRHLSDIIFKTT